MDDSPVNYPLNGSKNAIPTGSENARCLLPAQAFRPRGQKESIRERLLIVAAGPRDSFCGHATTAAVHPPHPVDEKYRDAPKGNKFKPAQARMIVGCPLFTTRTANRPGSTARPQRELDLACFRHARLGIHKALLLFYAIQDSL